MDRVQYESIVIQDLINLYKDQALDLSPWYQRRAVWSKTQKAYLVNTLHEQKPVPALYIRHSLDLEAGRSIKEVVDGQQRSRAIIEYYFDEFASAHPEHDRKVKYSQLRTTEQHDYLLTSIPVGYLLGATDEDVIDIFGRINSVSKSLNAQEKRNAAYSGDFKQFCLKQAASRVALWRTYDIFTANEIARMQEVQFISDLIYNLLEGLSDFASSKLDAYYAKFDEAFPEQRRIEKRLDSIFNRLVKLNPEFFRETIFTRQPLFFSLCVLLDSTPSLGPPKIKSLIEKVDERMRSPKKSDPELAFEKSISASTQRIAQRRVRDKFLSSMIK